MQQPQQPRYFHVLFFVRLRPSHFTLCACVLNISNDNNVYRADLYSGSVNLHLTILNRQRMRERSTDRVQLPVSVLQPSHVYLWKQVVMSKESEICFSIDTLLVSWAFKNGAQSKNNFYILTLVAVRCSKVSIEYIYIFFDSFCCFINTMNSDILLFSPTVFHLLHRREVCDFGRSQ